MSKKNSNQSLGKALQRQQEKKKAEGIAKVQQGGQFYHDGKVVKENYEVQQEKLQSIVDQNPLNEYLQLAELANVKYNAEKRTEIQTDGPQPHYIPPQPVQAHKQVIINVNAIRVQQLETNNIYDFKRNQLMKNLQIPRRPIWNDKTTVEELRSMENESFLAWRKELAKFEEENYQIQLTPYEKNIEVWKQLWRVVEKSDILIQVVDCRDILFYHCQDLVKYINEEQNRIYHKNEVKQNFLLINKSDLMSEEIRILWNKFLLAQNINHMFFSALLEQEKIDQDKEEEQLDSVINTHHIVNRQALLRELKDLVTNIRKQRFQEGQGQEIDIQHDQNMVMIGMVGYPNVGKSSVINTLCSRKLVGVAARPGKTKHFQTIPIEKYLMLCDCPGLIFPNAASSRAEMVCNGVLPIDNIKDYLSPMDLLCDRIPKVVFEKFYSISLPFVKLESSQLLQTYSTKRGYYTGRGLPDEVKAAKIMLKDLMNGKLLYVKVPPDCTEKVWQSNHLDKLQEILTEEAQKIIPPENKDGKIDNQFENHLIQAKQLTNEEIIDLFSQEELIQLMEGRRVFGIKLTKEQRREIKYAYQRGDPVDLRKYIILNKSQKEEVYKTNIQGKKVQF